MALIKNLDYEEEGKAKSSKAKKSKKTKVSKNNPFLALIVAVVVILVILAVVFTYTNGKLSDLQQDGEKSEEMKQEIASLQQEIENLTQKAQDLQEENEQNKEIVIDLFDKNRELPTTVDTADWLVYNNSQLDFEVQIPNDWEVAKTIVDSEQDETETTESEPAASQAIYLQPKDEPMFALAMTLKNEYLELASLPLEEKYELFKDLKVIDEKSFSQGKMMYFIDIDKNNNEIPTVLILADRGIFKATFNVVDKNIADYFQYRLDFEKIVRTFIMVEPKSEISLIPETQE